MNTQTTISRSIDINVSAQELWSKTAEDFGGIDKWIASVADVSLTPADNGEALGTERVCVSPFGETHETMVIYDESNLHFAYEIEGLPPIVARGVNNWIITPQNENRSSIEFRLEIEFAPIADDEMKAGFEHQIGDLLGQAVEELKHYVETGEPHPRKLTAMSQ